MNLQYAAPKDAPILYELMMYASSLLPDPGWYCTDTEAYIYEHILDEKKGMVLKAVEGDRTAAFFLIHYPGMEEGNLGNVMGFQPESLCRVAHMDSLAVHPGFRGHGLQKKLMAMGETCLLSTPYCHLMATVHPDNRFSLNNFLTSGYRIVTTTVKYGGLPRHILYKHL